MYTGTARPRWMCPYPPKSSRSHLPRVMILKGTCPKNHSGWGVDSRSPPSHESSVSELRETLPSHVASPGASAESRLTAAARAPTQYIRQRLRVLYQQLSYRTVRGMTGPMGGRALGGTHSREATCRRWGLG